MKLQNYDQSQNIYHLKGKFNLKKILSIVFILSLLISLIIMLSFWIKSNNSLSKPFESSSSDYSEKISTLRKIKGKLTGFTSEKWVVVITINDPTPSIYKLNELNEPWKIVFVGDKKTKSEGWKVFANSNKLVFLSIEDQEKFKLWNYTVYLF